jgi:predicted site-specific integrase-resolvase
MTTPPLPTATEKPRLMTPTELANAYRIPTATAAKWRWAGTGPAFVKFGSRVLYRESDVEAWIAANLRTSTAANDPTNGSDRK